MAAISVVAFRRQGAESSLVDAELRAIAKEGRAAAKDMGRLRAVVECCWRATGFECTQLDFRPIEGAPYFGKLWEARYLKTSRSDGVHGYRLFYLLTRAPDARGGGQVVVLLKVFAKEGDTTPTAVLKDAWNKYQEVEKLIQDGTFWGKESSYGPAL